MSKSNEVYFSHSFAGNQRDIDLVRRILKERGYKVIEHSGPWTEKSMEKFLECENKLFFPLDGFRIGRGQCEMLEAAYNGGFTSFVITDFELGLNPNDSILDIAPVINVNFRRNDMRIDWGKIEYEYDQEEDIGSYFPILQTSYTQTGRLPCSVPNAVVPMLATAMFLD